MIDRIAGERFRNMSPVTCYGSAVAAFLVAFGLRYALEDLLPPGFPYITFFPAIVLATFFFGTRPGLVCAVLSFFASWYFFLPPGDSFALDGARALALAFFIFVAGVDIYIIDRLIKFAGALAEARHQASAHAEQRDGLFTELQHRVGNNLMMVASLLKVQGRGLADPKAKAALNDAARRVGLVAEINRLFHNPKNTMMRFDNESIRQLAIKCTAAAGHDHHDVEVDIEPLPLPQETFLPVALAVTESINNAIEHGFADGQDGTLTVRGRHEAENYRISIADSGNRLPEGFDLAESKSIGLTLIRGFATQLNGSYSLARRGNQTVAELVFRLPAAAAAT